MGHRVAPVGAHIPKFVGRVHFGSCRRMGGNSALIVVRSTRFHLRITRTRTNLHKSGSDSSMIATDVNAAGAGIRATTTNVRRTHISVVGTGRSFSHFTTLVGGSTMAHRRCSGTCTHCLKTGTHCRRTDDHGTDTTSIHGIRARRLNNSHTKRDITRTRLGLTHLGLSCAMVITAYSNIVKEGSVRRNRLMRPNRVLTHVISSGSI